MSTQSLVLALYTTTALAMVALCVVRVYYRQWTEAALSTAVALALVRTATRYLDEHGWDLGRLENLARNNGAVSISLLLLLVMTILVALTLIHDRRSGGMQTERQTVATRDMTISARDATITLRDATIMHAEREEN